MEVDRHQVMITFSHNHCGPRLGTDLVDYYPIEATRSTSERLHQTWNPSSWDGRQST